MPVKLNKPTYNDLVFINCPFDEDYLALLRALVFTVYRCGFFPTTAMAEDNAMDNRIDKISRLIESCKFGIHDISRTELNDSGLPRFNMPFELGLFYGARRYGHNRQKNKNALILERRRYSYQKYLSDINGIDIRAHGNQVNTVIRHVRNWLRTASRRSRIPGEHHILQDYREFSRKLPRICRTFGFANVNAIPFNDYANFVEEAIRDKLAH